MMVCLLLYAYCVGVFSSRKIALACERNLAFLAIVGQERQIFAPSAISAGCISRRQGRLCPCVPSGGRDGTRPLGQCCHRWHEDQGMRHGIRPLVMGHMQKAVKHLREEIEALVTQAYQQDVAEEAAAGQSAGEFELLRSWPVVRSASCRLPAMRRLETQAKADAQVKRQRRAAAKRAQTDGPPTPRQSPPTGGRDPRRQGPE